MSKKDENEKKRIKEEPVEEELIEITFGNIRPSTDEEKRRFDEVIKNAKESGEIDDIYLPKFFDDGRVELIKLEDIEKK